MANGTWGGIGDRHPYKVRVSWQNGADVCQIGFHMRAILAAIGNPETLANNVGDWVTSDFRNLLGSDQRLNGVDVLDMVTGEGYSLSFNNVFGGQTRDPNNQAPSFLCCVVSMKSSIRRRYGQGRFYMPVVIEPWTGGDVLSPAGSTALQSLVNTMAARFVNGTLVDYTMINVHGEIPAKVATPSRPARPAVPPSWYDVQTLRLNTRLTALRSRKIGQGS